MKYIARVIEYSPRAQELCQRIEEAANLAWEKEGLRLVTFSVTGSAKAVAVFAAEEK